MAVWEHKARVLKLIWRALVFPLFVSVCGHQSVTDREGLGTSQAAPLRCWFPLNCWWKVALH